VIANNDYFPHTIPRSKDFTRVNSAVWIFGNRTEWMRNCHYYPENLACMGNGTSFQDNLLSLSSSVPVYLLVTFLFISCCVCF
jgi:hypothetical protein